MKTLKKSYLFTFIAIVIITAGGYGIWKLVSTTDKEETQIERQDEGTVNNDISVEDDSTGKDLIDNQVEKDDSKVPLYEGWNTYNNDKFKITFKYPADWDLVEEVNEEIDSLRVIVSKNTYEFDLYIVAGSPDICDFSSGNFEELSNEEKVYRIKYQEDLNQYQVCMKEIEGQTFVTWTDPGYILYHVPKNPDESYLEILNNILLSRNR